MNIIVCCKYYMFMHFSIVYPYITAIFYVVYSTLYCQLYYVKFVEYLNNYLVFLRIILVNVENEYLYIQAMVSHFPDRAWFFRHANEIIINFPDMQINPPDMQMNLPDMQINPSDMQISPPDMLMRQLSASSLPHPMTKLHRV